jgi:carboxypeptidase Taq
MNTNIESAYGELLTSLRRLDRLQSIGGLLGWDELTLMPPGGTALRGEQKAALTEIICHEARRPEICKQVERLEALADQLNDDQRAVVREARRSLDQFLRIPPEFAARKSRAQSASYQAWVKARADNDFPAFLPHLREQLALAREQAAFFDDSDAYDYWIDQFDPGMTRAAIEPLFAELAPQLRDLAQRIISAPNQPREDIFRGFPIDRQEQFLRSVVSSMGFDFNRGRIDTSVHPFCGGHPMDTRMTTRFDADNPIDSLSSSMHETGHALYEQGLDDEFAGTALGMHVGMAVHESQSRLWENMVGRSEAFWQYWEPRYRELFDSQLAGIDSAEFLRAFNRVAISPIRVDADEITYNLHIILRFELEKGMFAGTIALEDLPDAWNQLSSDILGYTPTTHREGCLQDVHWSDGLFGYFPSYCLGNLLAAQLWQTVQTAIPDLSEHIASGRMAPLLEWLRSNIHARGRREYTQALAMRVTGKELSTAPLVSYLQDRYLPLYRLNS